MKKGLKRFMMLAAGIVCALLLSAGTAQAQEQGALQLQAAADCQDVLQSAVPFASDSRIAQQTAVSFAAVTEMADGHVIVPLAAAMAANQHANVRSGPGTSCPVLGSLETGEVVTACGQADNGWYQVIYGGRLGYVSGKLLTNIPVDAAMQEALAAQGALVKQQAAQTALTEQQQAAAALQQSVPAGSGNVIFVGDSRTGQMANAVGGTAAYPNAVFQACYGGGVEWLSTAKAKKDIDQFVTPGSVIIINYGVNDLSKHNEYISVINRYSQDWRNKGAVVYFATVGPVGENEYGKRNWAVEYFNNQLLERLDGSIGRIDLYSWLTVTGYTTLSDGLHYTPDVYARMFQFLMQSVGKM